MLKACGIAVCILLGCFTVCAGADDVITRSRNLMDTCYDLCFSIPDVSFQKEIILVMGRCLKPIKLTAGKLADLSMNLYVTVSIRV